jgi:hypothetical protein
MNPRLVNREHAAAYCGIEPAEFDQLVAVGTLPGPLNLLGCLDRWDVHRLDQAVDNLSLESEEAAEEAAAEAGARTLS